MTAAVALAAVALMAGNAAAGGSWISPVRDRYEPGEIVTLVGYAGPSGSAGTVHDGPFFAYLHRLEGGLSAPHDTPKMAPFTPQPTDRPLGQLTVEPTGRSDYATYRMSIHFRLPSDLTVGRYAVSYCNATCTKGLTELIGGVIFVGIHPDHPITREWPLSEPEIANLPDTAALSGPGGQMTAGDARARPPEPPPTPHPSGPASPPTALETEQAARRAPDSGSGGAGAWAWVVPATLGTAVVGAAALAAAVRSRPRRS
jgi:hypothetical protein